MFLDRSGAGLAWIHVDGLDRDKKYTGGIKNICHPAGPEPMQPAGELVNSIPRRRQILRYASWAKQLKTSCLEEQGAFSVPLPPRGGTGPTRSKLNQLPPINPTEYPTVPELELSGALQIKKPNRTKLN